MKVISLITYSTLNWNLLGRLWLENKFRVAAKKIVCRLRFLLSQLLFFVRDLEQNFVLSLLQHLEHGAGYQALCLQDGRRSTHGKRTRKTCSKQVFYCNFFTHYIPQLSCSMGPTSALPGQQSELFCPSHHCSEPQQVSAPYQWHSPQCWSPSVTVKCYEANWSSPNSTTN